MTADAKLAVLIDADNTRPGVVQALLTEVATYGTAHVKRAYGDWTGPNLKGWKEQLLAWSIQPVQQFAYTTGKNATDAAMVIDAMDLLYTGRLDAFCLVSSDSDFTRLAARLRESGLTVYGFGERRTPAPFVAACDKFIHLDNLTTDTTPDRPDTPEHTHPAPAPPSPRRDTTLHTLLDQAVDAGSDADGWAPLAHVGHIITTQHPDFDPRTYRHAKLTNLVEATGRFDVDRRYPAEDKPAVVYIRRRPPSDPNADHDADETHREPDL
ncbi:NYN domain-containing protein [Saccharothrix algeriensis]|uniref:Fe-S-cluster formation regulator IscX/YfhJ n=1 Tax=Saccharothrix algeriensis TaxID=173560 RepID=A0ABS2S3S5_9PSEU|nr:NYN domain-containing protein [Saccharothrix algeriensis]MBM7810505.1 Fe-S-cluster formation regulator IscX/YfhJ [Saccharothrix algeriensis]